ncbi:flagellar basal body-associated FliL family protein [Pseudoroseicyclus tamaricis]|uniref:Flagellar protein FliL n=1 Tax=Pseudoroseicyclus tamaricis TaxID=2705421 RepID=A0A6B2JNA5_9RHOB|nr:flagellar basal body-associated FliL family protein [Pseudoroseicyclus tamaricis]NDU99507.1 flagellar basal body-associated FliL family protein [Pseudoroseicyclus tamaricis]
MKKLLLPLLLALVGTGGGVGAAMFLLPAAEHEEALGPCGDVEGAGAPEAAEEEAGEEEVVADGPSTNEYAKLNNQFVVPVVREGQADAMMLLSLSIEIPPGQQSVIFAHEPRLRDVFLQVLFDHSNVGGFEGNFTAAANMRNMRDALRAAGREVLGDVVKDVLVTDIVRQRLQG